MSNRIKRLLLFLAVIFAVGTYWSCTQPPDVLAPISTSEVTLSPRLLPSSFPGMHYELWVSTSTEAVSLGKFKYDNNLKRFLELSGTVRNDGNLFILDDNIYRFSKLFVSVETDNDLSPNWYGPIMLIDDVTDPANANVDLVFPLNEVLWEATARFNMETTSDSNDFQDGYGLWFSSYQRRKDSIRDTFSLDSFMIDTTYEVFSRDTVIGNLIDVQNPKDTIITRIFGVDSFSHSVVRYTQIVQIDTTRAGDSSLVTDPTFYFTVGAVDSFPYDEFTQDSFALPDYSSFGWSYKGWVVSPYVDPSFKGEVTLPAWPPNTLNDSLMPGIKSLTPGLPGGLLTTGKFNLINKADNTNPFVAGPRLPQFPGEDFLNFSSGPPWIGPGGLVPFASGNSGTVFISFEPNNFITDTTNFPLIGFMGKVPAIRDLVTDSTVIINMWNRTQVSDPRIGFPRITVNIKAY